MRTRTVLPLLIIGFLIGSFGSAQVKIGDNPQTIDPASVLELESTERVLVITRVDSVQMSNIIPNRGALVYNTTADCVFYYNGTDWINLCGGGGAVGGLTTDPIVNPQATIVITPTPNGGNIEIAESSINSRQIIDGGINGIDIQNGSIGRGKLQNNSVDRTKLAENSVGPFAIDNDSIDLADFNNVTGFIRDTDLAGLESSVTANTAAIASDGDTDNTNELQELTLSGNTIVIENGNTIDLTPILSDGGTDNQILTLTGNILEIEDGNTVDFTPILGGGGDPTSIVSTTTVTVSGTGTATDPYELTAVGGGGGGDDNQTAAEVPVSATPINYTQTSPDVEGHLAGIDVALGSGGGGGSDDQTAAEVPFSPYRTIDSTNTQAAVQELKDELDALEIAGGGSNNELMEVTTDSLIVQDAGGRQGILLTDLPSTGSNNELVAVTTDSLIVQDAGGRQGILLTDLPSNGSNVELMAVTTDSLIVQDAGGRTGILLTDLPSNGSNVELMAVTTDSLIVQDAGGRKGILLTDLPSNGSNNELVAVTTDSLIVQDAGGRKGILLTDLPSNGSNNELVAVTTDSLIVQDAGGRKGVRLAEIGGGNLSTNNLTQTEGQDRIYDLNGQDLYFSGDGNIGIGTFGSIGNPPSPNDKLDVNGQIRTRRGFAANPGTAGQPSYGFYTDDDTNTGMFRAGPDQIGFSVGGFEALRIQEPSDGVNKVVVNQTLELEGQLLDVNNVPGDEDQILSSTGTGVEWVAAPEGSQKLTGEPGGIFFAAADSSATTFASELFWDQDNDRLGIGIIPEEDLHVAGSIRTETNFISTNDEIVVPDYVFEEYFLGTSTIKAAYNFKSLEEIKSFIKIHHHLPGVKSAAEVKKDGFWNLSESNLQNLEKIEELFLHTIEQEKKIDQLQSEKEVLSDEVRALRNELEEIKAMRKDLDEIKAMLKKSE